MLLRFIRNRKRVEILREEVQESFRHVRKDVNKIGDWIRHLDDKDEKREKESKEVREKIDRIEEEIEDLKASIQFLGQPQTHKQPKHQHTTKNTQTEHLENQTNVQTDVQTDKIDNLTVMERGIVWALLNAEMKLSYEDIAALLGKDKSTIRGQINAIKQKIQGLIKEIREQNGKKRLYIEDQTKKDLRKQAKLQINT